MADSNDILLGRGDAAEFIEKYLTNVEDITERKEKARELANKLGDRYIDTGIFADRDWSTLAFERGQYEGGHLTEESWEQLFGPIFEAQKKYRGGRTFFGSTRGGFYYKQGENEFLSPILQVADLVTLMGENPKLEDGGYDVPRAAAAVASLIRSAFDAENLPEYGYEKYFMEGIPDYYNTIVADVAHKEGALWKGANKSTLTHSMWGEATAPQAIDQRWGSLADIATRLSDADARKLFAKDASESEESYLAALKRNYYHMYGTDQAAEDRLATILKYKRGAKGRTAMARNSEALLDFLIGATTYGSDEFNKRLAAVGGDMGALRGWLGGTLRFPLSNSEDYRATDFFIDPELVAGQVVAAFGAGRGINLDWDGDKIALLATGLYGGDKLDDATIKQQVEDFNKLSDDARRTSAIQAYLYREAVVHEDSEGKRQGLLAGLNPDSDEFRVSLGKLIKRDAAQAAGLSSRLNKRFAGRFSNLYQGVVEGLKAGAPRSDSTAGISDDESILRSARDLSIAAIFEGFTQDAISAKKVRDRLSKGLGIDVKSPQFEESVFNTLDNLLNTFKNTNTYKSKENINRALSQAVKANVFGDSMEKGGFLGERATGQLIAKLYPLLNAGKYKQVAEYFGTDIETIKALEADYDPKTGRMKGWKHGDAQTHRGFTQDMIANMVWKAAQDETIGNFADFVRRNDFIPGGRNPKYERQYQIEGMGVLSEKEY